MTRGDLDFMGGVFEMAVFAFEVGDGFVVFDIVAGFDEVDFFVETVAGG